MRPAFGRQTRRVSNEIRPALGEGANAAGGDQPRHSGSRNALNGLHETYLLRERLLEPPRRPWQTATIVAVCALAIALITAGFAMFAMLAALA
jgi:hypothetical protein